MKGQDPLLNKMQRQDELSDMVNTTGTAFLATTMGCAKCHNHKFDPVTQTDFFAMQSVFAASSTANATCAAPDDVDRKARAGKLATRNRGPAEGARRPETGALPRIDPLHRRDRPCQNHPTGRIERRGQEPRGLSARLPRRPRWRGPASERLGRQLHLVRKHGRPRGLRLAAAAHGRKRVWLSWGCGFLSHTTDARYVLDRDGDPATRDDQTEIARVDQQKFADGTADVGNKAMWSGFRDAGEHEFAEKSAIFLRGGETGSAISADVLVLQDAGATAASRACGPREREGQRGDLRSGRGAFRAFRDRGQQQRPTLP